jgi:serine/threonine protein kinase
MIHRDIKPANFSIGKGIRSNVIYMIDFGLCKKFMDREGKHMSLRENKKFVGNVKYCSVNAHLGLE